MPPELDCINVEIKGFSVRNMQRMMQFFNEYNQELTMVKGAAAPIAQSAIAQLENNPESTAKSLVSQLGEYNFTIHIKLPIHTFKNEVRINSPLLIGVDIKV